LLTHRPATTENLALGLSASPEESYLRLPLKIIYFSDIFIDQSVDYVSLVKKKSDHIFHDQLLDVMKLQIWSELLFLETSIMLVEALDDLIDPEVNPKVESLQGLLAQVGHHCFFEIFLLASH